jgi:hypothetical protein
MLLYEVKAWPLSLEILGSSTRDIAATELTKNEVARVGQDEEGRQNMTYFAQESRAIS